jgi:hypothetical protein
VMLLDFLLEFDYLRHEVFFLAYTSASHIFACRRRDSVVGIETGYGLDARGVGVRVPVESRIFSSPRLADRL